MHKTRIIFLLVLLIFSIGLIVYLAVNNVQTRFKSTLSPAFQLVGKTTKSVNTTLTKVLPIDEMDEADYGNAIKTYYLQKTDTNNINYIYLNNLVLNLSIFSKKKFDYQVFVMNTTIPNAFAMPGGVIIITNGFLDIITSESELISVLGHEMGHIEREHCFNTIKYELLLKKFKMKTLGQIADVCINILLRHSYSKTQENEADEYGYALLLNSDYDPSGTYKAFEKLSIYTKDSTHIQSGNKARILNDYFSSHPPTALRIEKFKKDAENWWEYHSDSRKYVGVRNFKERISYYEKMYENEWISTLY